jgi:hypothetical protein
MVYKKLGGKYSKTNLSGQVIVHSYHIFHRQNSQEYGQGYYTLPPPFESPTMCMVVISWYIYILAWCTLVPQYYH